jgi:hypothetical protein
MTFDERWKSRFGSAWRPSSPAPRAELLHVLMLPDFDRGDRIGAYWATQASAWSEARPSACGYRGDPFRTKKMIASAATITAMMMMIPMLMAAIIRPPSPP